MIDLFGCLLHNLILIIRVGFTLFLVRVVDRYELLQVSVLFYFLVRAFEDNLACLHQNDGVDQVQKVDCVGDEHTGALFELLHEHMLENLFLHICIQSRNGVVHQIHLALAVDGSCEAHSSFLTAAEVDSLLSDLSQVSSRQDL